MSSSERTKKPHGSSALHSSSAEVIGRNQDLLVQILVWLPTKSLLKFKCVSKEWQSLISSPGVAGCHKWHVNSPSALLVQKLWSDDVVYEFVSLDSTHSDAPFESLTLVDDRQLKIIDSSNGLLLCDGLTRRRGVLFPWYFTRCYVYNPTTKQRTQLPPYRSPSSIKGVYLAFDPLKSPYYKVICVLGHNQDDGLHTNYEFDIYSSEQRRWKTCATTPFCSYSSILFDYAVFWNGSVHWLNRKRNQDSMYFNVEEEQPHVMPLPLIPDLNSEFLKFAYFGESRGHLHLAEVNRAGVDSLQFNVYEMTKDYSEWRVKYRVNLGALPSAFPDMVRNNDPQNNRNIYIFKILFISRGETDEDSFMVLQTPRKIIRYDLKYGASFKKLCDLDDLPDEGMSVLRLLYVLFRLTGAYQYFESLACV